MRAFMVLQKLENMQWTIHQVEMDLKSHDWSLDLLTLVIYVLANLILQERLNWEKKSV